MLGLGQTNLPALLRSLPCTPHPPSRIFARSELLLTEALARGRETARLLPYGNTCGIFRVSLLLELPGVTKL